MLSIWHIFDAVRIGTPADLILESTFYSVTEKNRHPATRLGFRPGGQKLWKRRDVEKSKDDFPTASAAAV
jgi:hypothetical protein